MDAISVLEDRVAYLDVVKGLDIHSLESIEDVISYRSVVAKRLIQEDIKRQILPENLSGFSDIHDYMDGNVYLLDEQDTEGRYASFYNWPELDVAEVINCFNRVIDNVDAWLVSHQGAGQ